MAGFIEGADRSQLSLLPGSLDDWICSDNPVRVIDAFVNTLDLNKLGFEVEALDLGRPGYDPFARDVALDPGRASAPRIAVPHILPSSQ